MKRNGPGFILSRNICGHPRWVAESLRKHINRGSSQTGQSLPHLLAELIHDLSKEATLEDLEIQLPYSTAELRDSLELLELPDGLDAWLEEEAERQERERPVILSFAVDGAEPVERALEEASIRHTNKRARKRQPLGGRAALA